MNIIQLFNIFLVKYVHGVPWNMRVGTTWTSSLLIFETICGIHIRQSNFMLINVKDSPGDVKNFVQNSIHRPKLSKSELNSLVFISLPIFIAHKIQTTFWNCQDFGICWLYRNWVFVLNLNFLIPISLQPDCVNFWYFKPRLLSYRIHNLKFYDIEFWRYR